MKYLLVYLASKGSAEYLIFMDALYQDKSRNYLMERLNSAAYFANKFVDETVEILNIA